MREQSKSTEIQNTYMNIFNENEVGKMNKIEIYKELVRYGSIMRDSETKSEEGYHRTTVYSYQGMEFTVIMLNGKVVTVDNTTIF